MPYPIYSKTSPAQISELAAMMSRSVSGACRVLPGPWVSPFCDAVSFKRGLREPRALEPREEVGCAVEGRRGS